MISDPSKRLNMIFPLVILVAIAFMPCAGMDNALAQDTNGGRSSNPYLVETFVDEDGRLIDKIIVPGRPPAIRAPAASVPESNPAMGINAISNVPAFDWSYGCSATSAAMMMGYYDNTGYPNMYAGPTNGGVCPMDNSVWGPGIGGSPGECPLSATHKGKDGRTTKGHVDDYWVSYASKAPDPFIGNWTEHSHGDCTGDFMGTNQSLVANVDGETTFYFDRNGDLLYDCTACEPDERDGCHGLRLFAQSRGYTIVKNFSQYIRGQGADEDKGFTFAAFQSEIDAGRPVLIQVEGHSMLGYGYNASNQTVYLHDTWDRRSHSMTWGSTYEGLQHRGVTVIQLEPAAAPNNPPNMPSNPSPANHATGLSIDADLSWSGGDPDVGDTVTYDVYFGTGPSLSRVSHDQSACTYDPGTLNSNTKYYWKIIARDNHGAPTVGPLWDFTTEAQPEPGMTWNFPATSNVFLGPTPANGRPYLDAAVSLPTDTEPENLSGIYCLNEATGEWQYFIPAFGDGTLTSLQPGQKYLVTVSGPCSWNLPCGEGSASPVGDVWKFPSISNVFLGPTPANSRPYLDAAVTLPTGTEPTELLGVYWLDEATGEWQYFIAAFGGGTLTSLQPGQSYLVAVSGACSWNLP